MNKRIFWFSAIVVTVLALSLNAVAQPPGGGQGGQRQGGGQFGGQFGGGATSPAQLLRNAEVVTLLGLTTEQTDALTEALRPQQRGQGGQGGGAIPTPAELRARTDATWESIGKILKEEQLTKFKEVYFQASNGLNAPLLDARLLCTVGLTEDQAKKINEIADKRTEETRGVTPLGQDASPEERTAARTAATERNTKYNDQIKAVLTDEQKKKAEELTAGAADLRTKLGIPAQGQRGERGGQQGQGGRQGGGRGGNN